MVLKLFVLSVNVTGFAHGVVPPPDVLNVAVTARLVVIESVQVAAVPAQAPPQPANVEPAAAVAVRVTDAPDA